MRWECWQCFSIQISLNIMTTILTTIPLWLSWNMHLGATCMTTFAREERGTSSQKRYVVYIAALSVYDYARFFCCVKLYCNVYLYLSCIRMLHLSFWKLGSTCNLRVFYLRFICCCRGSVHNFSFIENELWLMMYNFLGCVEPLLSIGAWNAAYSWEQNSSSRH